MKNNIKRLFSLLLALLTVFTAVSVPVFAEGSTETSQNVAGSIYDSVGYSQALAEERRIDLDGIPSINGVTDPTAATYKIDSVAAYQNFVSLVNGGKSFVGKTIYLACNLDLTSVADQAPIGFSKGVEETSNKFDVSESAQFSGTFDGQGYAVTGISVNKTVVDTRWSGWMGWAVNAKVVDLVLSGKVSHPNGTYSALTNFVGTGGLIGQTEGSCTIDNVYCDVDVEGIRQTAGFIARGGATITNSTNAGDVTGVSCAGGLIGYMTGTPSVVNCLNTGRMESSSHAGGIVARGRVDVTVDGCVNAGTIIGNANSGGIVGVVDMANVTATVKNCTNSGFILNGDPIGTKSQGILIVEANNTTVPYIGYNPEGFVKPDLNGYDNITTWSAGSAMTAYKITDGAGLKKLSEIVRDGNDMSGVKIYLANDIDMSNVEEFLPIGNYTTGTAGSVTKPFSGTFDGLGHCIKNLNMSFIKETECGYGIFGYTVKATIQNLVIDSSCSVSDIVSSGHTGLAVLVGVSGGDLILTNIANYANATSIGHAAGLVGRNGSATIKYCSNYGDITSENCAGGLTGFRVGGNVMNSANYGTIRSAVAGGLMARSNSAATHQNLANYGVVIGSDWAGGIVGRKMDNVLTLSGCTNYGTVASTGGGQTDAIYTLWTEQGYKNKALLIGCADFSKAGYNVSCVEDTPIPAYDIKDYVSIAKQDAYVIRDAQGLVKLSELVNGGNSFASVTIYLANNINMFGIEMQPIGGTKPFSGIFDGRGKTVHGLNMKIDCTVEGNPNVIGLFGYAEGATIKNVIVDATCSFVQTGTDNTDSASAAAILAKGDNVSIENVKNQANVMGILHAAGIGGSGNIRATSCTNTGTIKGKNSAGGIFGYAASDVIDCVNYGDVSADNENNSGKAGGIAACQELADTKYINAYNYGVVSSDYMSGGVLGAVKKDCFLLNCANYGVATSLVGCDVVSSNCYNLEAGCSPAFTGLAIEDRSNIGYSADIAEAEKVDLDALLACGLAENIEDYDQDCTTGHYLIIDSPSDMRLFAQIINTVTRGKSDDGVPMTFYLACDIDMSSYIFAADRTMAQANTIAPIGWDQIKQDGVLTNTAVTVTGEPMYFAGTFDGQGHTISGLNMGTDDPQNSFLGLFGYLVGATVKNVILDSNCSIYTSNGSNGTLNFKAGLLAGGAENSTIRNVWTQGFVGGEGEQVAGVIGSPSDVSFINCTNSANVTGVANVGGFGGFASTMKLYNCRNTGNINGKSYVGGFTARDRGTGMYIQCVNIGRVTASESYAGAIAAYKDQAAITQYASCLNYGTISNSSGQTGKLFGGTANSNCIFRELTKTNYNMKADNYHIVQMLETKYQTMSNNNGTFNLRLLASVDSLSYLSAGFIITVEGLGSATVTTNKVYTTILGNNGEQEITYAPEETFADTSKYFITYTLNNLSDDYLTKIGTEAFAIKAFLITNDQSLLGHKRVDPISVANRYTANVTTSIGTIYNFETPKTYTLPGSDITIQLQYQAWPSVCVDENGVIYAVISGRLEHTDPFGHHLMYKSNDSGASWEGPYVINDTPSDDRDIGLTYLGGGRMLATYFRISVADYMTKGDTITTADGMVLTGTGKYTNWQKNTRLGSTEAARAEVYKKIKAYWSTMDAADLAGGNWCMVTNDYGASWSKPRSAPVTTPHGAIKLSTGEILYVGRNGSRILAYMSYDDGYSWCFNSIVYDNTSTIGEYYGLTFCEPHVTELQNGRWLVAIRIQTNETITVENKIYTGAGFDGATGTPIYKWIDSDNVTHTYRFVPQEDGTKKMVEYEYTGTLTLFRTFTMYSDDEGKTWSAPVTVKANSLANGSLTTKDNEIYGAPPHFVQMEDGTVVMVYASRNGNIGERALVSHDGGETWGEEILLCDKVKDDGRTFDWESFSYVYTTYKHTDIGYPATVYLGNGQFVTVYYQAAQGDDYCSFQLTKWSLTAK